MISSASMPMYHQELGWKWLFTNERVLGMNWPTVGGKAISAAAKMTGITPAMFTRRGMYVEPPLVIRRPTCRFAYWIAPWLLNRYAYPADWAAASATVR